MSFRPPSAPAAPRRRPGRGLRLLLIFSVLAGFLALEMRSSWLQSRLLSGSAGRMHFALLEGQSPEPAFPSSGPYDERLGYQALPDYLRRLQDSGYAVVRQARASDTLASYIRGSGHAIYREKDSAGLTLLDHAGRPLYSQRFPQRVYQRYEEVPELLAQTLLFIEDRKLFDDSATRNPAVDWPRFLGAALYRLPPGVSGGGGASTLATQIEKLRHSPGGLTHSPLDKLLQMRAASLRAYLDGPDTRAMRRRILATYLNAAPLGSRPGLGEIVGLGDALWAWYGTDFRELGELLQPGRVLPQEMQARAGQLYRQALSLMAAQRRPAFYLGARRQDVLDERTAYLLDRLREAGIVDEPLYRAASASPLQFLPRAPRALQVPLWQRKAADGLRTRLMRTLGAPGLYDLDRLDLTAYATLDAPAQAGVSAALARLTGRDGQPAQAPPLLGPGAPEEVIYSLLLYERKPGHNLLRLRADSLNAPLDLNSGSRLDLGSTAKLRTLLTYLQVIAELHARLSARSRAELSAAAAAARDPLTRWTAGYLQMQRDRRLAPLLAAALQRRYSASPHQLFYTGGAEHVFGNFDPAEDNLVPTVESAFRQSINLSFIRLMSDLVQYELARAGVDLYRVLSDRHHPRRAEYLERFGERESREQLLRHFAALQGRTPDQILDLQLTRCGARLRCAAATLRALRPELDLPAFAQRLAHLRPAADSALLGRLYALYRPGRWSSADLAWMAGEHPLRLWLATYLQRAPEADRERLLDASTDARRDSYRWLLRTRSSLAQNQRILTVLEVQAFEAVGVRWRALGYPFARLVPSLATALGTSGDRPEALAQLMGIVVNDGVRQPTLELAGLRFAADTPYETWLAPTTSAPQRLLAPEIAAAARHLLDGVVQSGTAQRLRGGLHDAQGHELVVGGKTGTSDQRIKVYDESGQAIVDRQVNRTATFVFHLGERYFGTLTACVLGPQAAHYQFNSAFAVQLLRDLEPQLAPLLKAPTEDGTHQRVALAPTASLQAVAQR